MGSIALDKIARIVVPVKVAFLGNQLGSVPVLEVGQGGIIHFFPSLPYTKLTEELIEYRRDLARDFGAITFEEWLPLSENVIEYL